MIDSPLSPRPLFSIGPVPVATSVVTTAVMVALLALCAALATRRLKARPGRGQAALELLVESLSRQLAETVQADPRPFLPLVGTLFIFLAVANASAIFPGVKPPTAQLETAAALALVVFLAVHVEGVRRRGLRGYLKSFAEPTLLMVPFNLIAQVTRTFSLMVRLFGNVVSGEFTLGVVLALAGLLVPIPLMALEVLVGLVQAYIFAVLAAVFLAAAAGTVEGG